MIAALPIPLAHQSAVSYERRDWGRKLYREAVTDHGCVRVSRDLVRCRFSFDVESTTGPFTMRIAYATMVRRTAHHTLVWESKA